MCKILSKDIKDLLETHSTCDPEVRYIYIFPEILDLPDWYDAVLFVNVPHPPLEASKYKWQKPDLFFKINTGDFYIS